MEKAIVCQDCRGTFIEVSTDERYGGQKCPHCGTPVGYYLTDGAIWTPATAIELKMIVAKFRLWSVLNSSMTRLYWIREADMRTPERVVFARAKSKNSDSTIEINRAIVPPFMVWELLNSEPVSGKYTFGSLNLDVTDNHFVLEKMPREPLYAIAKFVCGESQTKLS